LDADRSMKTILYVDDEAGLPAGFPATAEGLGFQIEQARSADAARDVLGEKQIALVILEPLLEGGWELLGRLAAERRSAVVLTRGDRSPQVYGRALDLGIREFLCKPALRSELLECVLEIESRGSSEPLEPVFVRQREDTTAATSSGRPGGATHSGPLSASSLIALLVELRASGASGLLRIDKADDSLAVELRNGSIVARSRSEEEHLDEFLERTGRITARERGRLLDAVEAGQASMRDVLIDQRFLGEAEVEEVLRDRAEERLWVALAWTDGTYRFEPDAPLDPRSSLEIEREMSWLLYEAVQKAPDGRAFAAWLRSQRDRIVVPATDRQGRFVARFEKDEGRELLKAISEERTVGDVLASGAIGERALYGLVAAGWAECLEEIVPFDGDSDGDGDCDVALAARPPVESAASAGEPAPAPAPETAGSIALAVASAPAAEVKKTEAERALEAERWFRDGKGFLATKRFQQAAEAFGMAAHLDPGEGEYAAHLGYSLYLTNPKDTLVERESLEHIARGIKQSPSRELSYVFLGRIFKAKGDVEMAAKVFRRALKIRPDCHPARQELRLLEMRDAKKTSLFGRLLEK
jgi:DNA-binding response OmpR family regulator